MEGKCCKYELLTKYKYLGCFTFVCNICSKVREDHKHYSEKEMSIEKCENCDGNQIEIISVSQSESS